MSGIIFAFSHPAKPGTDRQAKPTQGGLSMIAMRPIRRTTIHNQKIRGEGTPPLRGSADVVKLLNEDFLRACREVFACAVFVERLHEEDTAMARMLERRGQGAVTNALTLCQVIQDLGGKVSENLDETDAVRRANRVVTRGWAETTRRRLRERARQLREANRPLLATRVDRLLSQ
jgi:hypothetical protein